MDKEREIKLQFLDEAQEYLRTIETALLGWAGGRVDLETINEVLRAAHSIKGGAGMMGYQTLSQLAHRLEDSFKVLKIQKSSIAIDAELERLLLAGLDCLSRVVDCNRQGNPVDPTWLDTKAHPLFEQLHDLLGDPQEEDANSVLLSEDGQDVIPLLFETEVEGCLQRLESVLADPELPCLSEELEILAQELGGLGEMLQLEPYSQLCQSVMQQLEAHPDQAEAIARNALEAWRRSQALILTGHFDLLPTDIELPDSEALPTQPPTMESAPIEEWEETQPVWANSDGVEIAEMAQMADMADIDVAAVHLPNPEEEEELHDFPLEAVQSLADENSSAEAMFAGSDDPEPIRDMEESELRVLEIKSDEAPSSPTPDSQETTVRIPVKQLEQLKDLFGELIIERNGLDLQLKRMRGLIDTLSRRVLSLEQTNTQLRSAYDKMNTKVDAGWTNRGNGEAIAYRSSPKSNPFSSGFDVLEMDRYSDLHQPAQEVMETVVQLQEVTSDIKLGLEDTEQAARSLNKTVKQLQTRLNQVRMRPLSDILDRFPRALRELSLQHGKSVQLKVYGSGTLVDRNILEVLNDPLMHLFRNAFDHGIEDPQTRRSYGKPEQGRIEIRASHHNNRTLIAISDDGAGIPLDKIRTRAVEMGLDEAMLEAASARDLLSLIFEPGFTTTEQVTDLSGRGVGMDVVRNHLKRVRGEIKVDTEPGSGTIFTLSVPYTLSVTRVLLAESHGMLMAFPSDTVQEIFPLRSGQTLSTAGSEVFNLNGIMVQLMHPERWLKFHCPRQFQELDTPPTIASPTVLIFAQGDPLTGLVVNRCWSEQEVAVRPVEGSIPLPSGFSSCAILGDGRVVPLVNVSELLHWITSNERAQPVSVPDSPSFEVGSPPASEPSDFAPVDPNFPPAFLPPQRNAILIVDDSINVRRFLALTLEKAGYRVEQAKDGQDALDKLLSGVKVQAAICDIEMPRLDGYGFLAQVKSNSHFKDLPILMLTSRTSEKHRQLALSLGASGYFSKPYNEQALLQNLEDLVHQ